MSLYSSLRQVLAPFAAKIKGIQTGYDGTVYNTPGEAVRQQISDLHVLIGDEPGTAIQSSAIGYGEDSNVEDALDGLNGRLDQIEQGGSGLTTEAKAALLACFRGVVWRSDVDSDALYSALDIALNPPANLSNISAVYTQSGAVDVGANLDTLRNDLVVTAHFSDSTTEVVTVYTLSGSLSDVGTRTITVSYGGKTTTFTVNVTSSWTYIWDLTQSLTDKVNGRVAVASAGSGVDAPVITNDGLAFTAATQMLSLGDINLAGKIIEIDVVSMDFKGLTSAHVRFLSTMLANGAVGIAPVIYHKDNGWAAYIRSGTASSPAWTTTWTSTKDRNLFNGKTVKLVNGSESTDLYLDGELLRSLPKFTYEYGSNAQNVCIAGLPSYNQSGGDQCYDMVISSIRIKDVEEA